MELKIVDLVSADFLSAGGSVPPWKRVLDAMVIVVASPVIVPVMLLIALFIKVVSPKGPVFFRQERIGFYGQPFMIFKFRTMHANAPDKEHQNYVKGLMKSNQPMIKMDSKGDSRFIKGASFLRATALDELPQLINVLRGEMSIVGPRPCTAYEYEDYSPWHSRRLEALPGLTGLWQVSGKNKLGFDRMIQLDVHYAENSSALFDLSIMLKTFPVLFSQVGEILGRRIAALRKRNDTLQPANVIAAPMQTRSSRFGFNRWSIRTRRIKKCQTRVTLESSDVDTGVRT